MTGSYIPIFVDSLIDVLNAVSWPGVKPDISEGDWEQISGNCVIVGATADGEGESSREWHSFGPLKREAFTVEITFGVVGHKQPASARRAAFAYFDAFWDAVQSIAATDGPRYGPDVDDVMYDERWEIMQPRHRSPTIEPDRGYECRVHSAVTVVAQIRTP